MQESLTITVVEAARLLGLGRGTAYRLVAAGRIPAVRLGRQLRVPRAALEQMLQVECDDKTQEGA